MKAVDYNKSILSKYTENIKHNYDLLERRHDLNHECYADAKAGNRYDLKFWREATYHSGSLLKGLL